MTTATANKAICQQTDDITRPKPHFRASTWANQFMDFETELKVVELYSKEIEVLKDEVRVMLAALENRMVETINLIDTLERLGISYHFHNEIEDKVNHIFNKNTNYRGESYDLYTICVHFRIFRQHGYPMSSEIFENLKDESGKFKEALKADVKGLLSLYEASHLRLHGETILDDALSFTTSNLKSYVELMQDRNPHLRKQVTRALTQPLHFSYHRIESRAFISIYEENVFSNKTLLKFAKLDYNSLQLLYRQELCELSRWYNELDNPSNLPYVRDRLVECFYWSVGTYYEPQYSLARIMLAKAYVITSMIDDTYDSYGKVEELDILTKSIQRWNISEINQLHGYMKTVYKILLRTYAEFEEVMASEGKTYAVYYVIEAIKEIARSYNVEAKWFTQSNIPSFPDYVANGIITCTSVIHTTASLLGMKSVTREDYEWLITKPKVLIASSIKGRLFNDLASYEREKKNGQILTGVDCYMKENSLTQEETTIRYTEMITNYWKDTNEECLKMPNRNVVPRILNFDRLVEVTYKNYQDGYTAPKKVDEDNIYTLFVDPIELDF